MVDIVICFLNLSNYHHWETFSIVDKRCIPKHSLWLPGKGHLRTDSSSILGISPYKNEYRRDGTGYANGEGDDWHCPC